MKFNRKLFKEAFKRGYKAAKRLNEAKFVQIDDFPEWALNYAMYGDPEGLDKEEIEMVDEFVAEHGEIIDVDEDGGFSNYPLFGLPCNCYTVTVAR